MNEGHHKSALKIYGLTFVDVGYYTCISDNDETKDAKIYVYVTGKFLSNSKLLHSI